MRHQRGLAITSEELYILRMDGIPKWPLALLEDIEISPYIAYRGPVPEWGQDRTTSLPAYTWWEIRQGQVTVKSVRGVTEACAGDWILIPHGLRRHQYFADDTRLISLNFRALWPSGKPLLDFPDPIVSARNSGLRDFAEAICQIVEESEGDSLKSPMERALSLPDALRLQSLLLSFLRELIVQTPRLTLSGPSSGDARLDSILAEIRRELSAGPLPYDAWNSRMGIGRSQIDRLARRHLGSGLKTIRDSLLDDEIRHEFAQGKLSSKELAAKYRFADAAHFSRWVRRTTGHAPKALRQKFI